MGLQMLVSTVNQDVRSLAERMNMETDAIVINQCGCFCYEEYRHKGHTVRCHS